MLLHSRTIANRTEPTFVLLRYSLGGDRPSQTAHLTVSQRDKPPVRIILRTRVVFHQRLHQRLAPQLQRLPPILHMQQNNTAQGYSKGSRGLFVLPRVIGIFADITISPGLWLRQCPTRYAFHAGRNLPDKEFRYLRTVIVTAAVYWGFGSQLRMLNTPLNLPAPGRHQTLYVLLRVSRVLCF